MGHRRLIQLTAACNTAVLALGLVAAATIASTPPDVAFDRGAGRAAASAEAADSRRLLEPGEDLVPVDPSARLVALPHHDLEYLPPVLREGALAGDPVHDGGCVWIEMDGEPHAVRWTPGFQAGFVPAPDGGEAVVLVDPDGRVRARAGETLYFTGALSGGSERLERCHVGVDQVWYVDEVSTDPPGLD